MEIISRQEAKSLGLKYYFTGIPCKNGNKAERYVSDCGCTCDDCKAAIKAKREPRKAEISEYNKAYDKANREEIAARQKRRRDLRTEEQKTEDREKSKVYWADNKDKKLEKSKRYRERHKIALYAKAKQMRDKNKANIAAKKKEYYQTNPHIKQASRARRRAVKKQATMKWDREFTDFVLEQAYRLKNLREEITGFEWHVDHMIPLQANEVCGLHVWNNFQVIPAVLNISKNNKLILTQVGEWLNTTNNK